MPYSSIEISEDGSNWISAFSWNNDPPPGDVDNSNISSYANNGDGEVHGENIPSSALLVDPGSPPPNVATGVAIDISTVAPAGRYYRYIRFRQPVNTPQTSNVDAIYRIN
jgi:hypothetical protein